MKVTAFNGSPRKNSNTAALIKKVFEPLEKAGIECELVSLAGKEIKGCKACGKCRENLDKRCVMDDDIVNDCIEKMLESDGIIIGSPTYFATLNAETKALIDRAGFVAKGNDHMFRRKVGVAVAAVRRAGSMNVFQAINNFYLINEMIIPGSIYWNMGMGKGEGEVDNDEEGMKIMEILGENTAWLLNKIKE
ncbi:flavodoxin family protein [Natranaerofaba carboxydovora]|uniref:flavodoxin family protein n=1 Tax=Natranaerofaba carboxydovora TaxID=2742683 RepID=UPI001F141430|nr:flavodoxin family protein [Natranaerofaba carboxydovora]UMZ74156.1 2-amino-4-deoxychorismate dehydrogenase [Natranaerofaba carboxydovora]